MKNKELTLLVLAMTIAVVFICLLLALKPKTTESTEGGPPPQTTYFGYIGASTNQLFFFVKEGDRIVCIVPVEQDVQDEFRPTILSN